MRASAREREEIARLIAAARAAAPAARLARGARASAASTPSPSRSGRRGAAVTGVIDLLAREGDGGCWCSTTRATASAPSEDSAALVERDYGVQRLLYALAVLRAGAPRVEVVHWFLERPQEWVARALRGASAASSKSCWRRASSARAQRGFAVSEQPHRGLCGLSRAGGLCSWSEPRRCARPAG